MQAFPPAARHSAMRTIAEYPCIDAFNVLNISDLPPEPAERTAVLRLQEHPRECYR
jgi:hypothetical protein